MNSRRLALGILLAAGFLGLFADFLIADREPGANVTLWVVAAAGAWAILARWAPALDAAPRWLLVPLVAAAAGFSWRSDPMLLFLDTVVIGIVLAAAAAPMIRSTGRLLGAEYRDLVSGAGRNVAGVMLGPFRVLGLLRPPADDPGSSRRTRLAAAAARGLLLAVPLTLVFGGLLVSADARFEQLVRGIVAIPLDELIPHIIRSGAVGWVSAGLLLLTLGTAPSPVQPGDRKPLVGGVEVTTILVVLNVLFLAFVAIQFGNLFGGHAFIAATEGLTYAGYARRGFFQLVVVCALALPVLLVLAQQVELEPESGRRFRALARLQVALLLLILGSAVHRLWLYIGEFGLSLTRLHASAALVWIGATLMCFAVTVLRERSGHFLRGSLAAGAIVLGTMHLINPAAVVVRASVARAESGASIDADYLASLGPDAVPSLVAALPELSPEDRTALERGMACHWEPPLEGFRDWSVSRQAAVRAQGSAPSATCDKVAEH